MGNKPKPVRNIESWEYGYSAEKLGDVITMPEVELLWKKERRVIYLAWATHQIEGRRSITGGAVLFTVRSVIALWGEPETDTIGGLYLPKKKDEPSKMPTWEDFNEIVRSK